MGPLKNSRYEKFAQMVASGLTGSEAYRQVAGATAGKNADVLAARWMDSPGVRERLNELKEANSRKATLTREQIIEFLCNAITASAANVEADSSLVQSAEFIDGKRVKLRIPTRSRRSRNWYGYVAGHNRPVLSCRPAIRWRTLSTQSAMRQDGQAWRHTWKTTRGAHARAWCFS
jgi:hypothetical protein